MAYYFKLAIKFLIILLIGILSTIIIPSTIECDMVIDNRIEDHLTRMAIVYK